MKKRLPFEENPCGETYPGRPRIAFWMHKFMWVVVLKAGNNAGPAGSTKIVTEDIRLLAKQYVKFL